MLLARSTVMSSSANRRRFGVVVPVKPPSVAKSRLHPLGERARAALVAAFVSDTVAAASGAGSVARVLVVTDDHELAGSLAGRGVQVIPDGTTDDLNGTLVQGAAELARQDPALHLVALCADLPALRSDELERALEAAPSHGMAFVPDADGIGTTMVVAAGLDDFRPSFGDGSRRRHLEQGAREIDRDDVPSLRRDVDTPADLEQVRRLGVGTATARVLDDRRL